MEFAKFSDFLSLFLDDVFNFVNGGVTLLPGKQVLNFIQYPPVHNTVGIAVVLSSLFLWQRSFLCKDESSIS